MKRKILILLCLVLLIVSIANVSAADDVNQTISDGNDIILEVSYDDTLTEPGESWQLQKLIDDAPAGATINLDRDYYGGVEINKALTVNGNNFNLYGYGDGVVCHANGIVLNNINFRDSYRGAIYSDVPLTINNCNFVNNTKSDGGAIYSTKDLKITNSTFSENSATGGDYVIAGSGAAIYAESNLFLNNCNFYNNLREAPVIYTKSIEAINSNFTNNGPVSTYNSDSYFTNCVFTGNRRGVTGYGQIKDCTFINNTAYGTAAVVVDYNGGAISGIVKVTNSTFINNNANNGGAISGYCEITNCTFINNAATRGGAVHSEGNTTIINSIFKNNSATSYGGAIYFEDSSNNLISSSEFIENMDINNRGGAIYIENSDLKVSDSSFIKNEAWLGGAFYIAPKPFLNPKNYLIIENSKLEENKASDYDGIIKITDNELICDLKEKGKVLVEIGLYDGNTFNTIDSCEGMTGYDGYYSVDLNSFSKGDYAKISFFKENGDKLSYAIIPITTESSIKLDVPDVTKNYGGSERLEITLTESGSPVAGADVNININGVDYTRTTDSNGKTSMAINLNSGRYYATVTYKDVSTKALVTVNALNTETTLSYTKNSHNSIKLTALVSPSTATGDVVFTVNGKDYTARITDGKATYQLSALAVGSYEAKATYNGDMNHKDSSSNTVKFTVEDVKVDVNAPDLTKYYKGPERFVVTVKEDGKAVVGKDVTINLNGATYTRTTNEKGEASMAINLNSGEYKVTSEFEGIKVDSTITVKQTVSGENITKIFRNGTQYYATFIDTSGKTLAENTAVEFNINGVFYTRYTNDKGVAKMNINLNPGEYVITAKNPNSTEMYTNIITVLPSIVENYNLTKYYRNASQYSLRLLDDKGNPVKAGVDIKLNINGVFYTRTSNATGYVNMNINLNPGEYTITAEYNGLMASNTIKVLSVIESKNLVMKYKDGSKFEAKILDGHGKAYFNQTVTFNINGVFYDKVTDENGIARLKINLMAGEYIITSSYNGLNAANKITISS